MSRFARGIAAAAVCAGLLVSGYLLARTFALLADRYTDAYNICSAVFGAGCDAALTGESSWLLGLPLAGWGVVYHAALGALLLLAATLGDRFRAEATAGALALSILGAAGSIALSVIMLGGWAPLCPLCMLVHGLNLALVPALWIGTGRSPKDLGAAAARGLAFVVGRGGFERDAAWKALGFVSVALVAVVAYQWVFVESTLRLAAAQRAASPEQVIHAYEQAPQQDTPAGDDDPRLGPAGAQVQMVVFSSFQCPACQELAGELRFLADHFPGRLEIVYKHYPLSKTCNPAVAGDKQPRSCQAARAAQAAHRQDKFWAYHDALFATDLAADEKTLRQVASQVGLDLTQFDADRRSPSVADAVAKDVNLGNKLGIDGTPSVFLNGRRVARLTPGALDILVHHLLEDHPQEVHTTPH